MGMIITPPPITHANGQRILQPPQSQINLGAEMERLGFQVVAPPVAFRLILCTVAPQKAGKTHFAFTAPQPIACLTTDPGTEEVAGKFMRAGKRVTVNRFKSAKEMIEGKISEKSQEAEWERWVRSYHAVIAHKGIRTLIIDTGTETWEICRLARFGKITQVKPHHYGPVNSEFSALVQEAFTLRNDLNVIWIHKVKKEYKASSQNTEKESWTGRWERAGFADLVYQADINIRHYFDSFRRNPYNQAVLPPAFGIEVLDSRYEMLSLVGSRFEEGMCNFEFLAESAFPSSVGTGFWR